MRPGLYAFAVAASFVGAAIYVGVVEQPARLTLGTRAMIKEWAPSNRRGTLQLSILAVVSAILATIQFRADGDVRWIIGGVTILATWPYAYFVMMPVNVWLCAIPPGRAVSAARKLMRDWGLLEWGHALIGLAAACVFAWALETPV
jgi:anthrone oxygenase-like protein